MLHLFSFSLPSWGSALVSEISGDFHICASKTAEVMTLRIEIHGLIASSRQGKNLKSQTFACLDCLTSF